MNIIENLIKLQENRKSIRECLKILKAEDEAKELAKIKQSFDTIRVDCTQRSRKLKLVKDEIAIASGDMNELKGMINEDERSLYDGGRADYKTIEKLRDRVDVNKGKFGELESMSMELMEKEEKLAEEKNKMISQLENMRNTYKTRKDKVDAEMKKAKKKLDALKKEKAKLEKNLPKELLEQFDSVMKMKRTAVAKLEDDMCTGCNMGVSGVTMTEANGKEGYAICENCGRILYVEE